MFKNRKLQVLGLAIVLVAALLVVLSAVPLPASVQVGAVENDRVFAVSNPAGLAQYHLSERGSYADRQAGLDIYYQSERVQAYPAESNEAGLAQYHLSERESGAVLQKGLEIYHQSERVQAYPAESNEAGLAQYHRSERESGAAIQNGLEIYHQSEWHGK
jgi:hypothetical protein